MPVVLLTNDKNMDIGQDETWVREWESGIEAVLARFDVLGDMDDVPTISLGADTLVCANLSNAFEQDFDVGLTWRDRSDARYNTDVSFTRRGAFWKAVAKRAVGHPKREVFTEMETIVHEEVATGNWDIAEFPCSKWNFPPKRECVPEDVKVMHFKGPLKLKMVEHYFTDTWK
jgi:hypothetical protein